MPRTARAAGGGYCYHVLNRGNRRAGGAKGEEPKGTFLILLAFSRAVSEYCGHATHRARRWRRLLLPRAQSRQSPRRRSQRGGAKGDIPDSSCLQSGGERVLRPCHAPRAPLAAAIVTTCSIAAIAAPKFFTRMRTMPRSPR